MHVHVAYMEVRAQPLGVCSHLPLCGSLDLNSGHGAPLQPSFKCAASLNALTHRWTLKLALSGSVTIATMNMAIYAGMLIF